MFSTMGKDKEHSVSRGEGGPVHEAFSALRFGEGEFNCIGLVVE